MINYFNEKSLHSVDPKGRILLPRDVRERYKIKKGDVLHCVPNLANPSYIEIRTDAQWKKYKETLRGADQGADEGETKKDSVRYTNVFKDTCTVDGQGRVLVPQWIRDVCNVAGSVAVVDMEDYIEVWAKENIAQKYADMVRAFKRMTDRIY